MKNLLIFFVVIIFFFALLLEFPRHSISGIAKKIELSYTTNHFKTLPFAQQKGEVNRIFAIKGPDYAHDVITAAYREKKNHDVPHLLEHEVGSSLFKSFGLSGFLKCSSDFSYGCLHGFFEQAFLHTHDVKEIANICEKVGSKESIRYGECIHGIGHGIASSYSWTDLEKNLAICDLLKNQADYCYDGVFMETQISAPATYYRYDNPLFPCTSLDARYQYACSRSQPFVMESRLHMSRAQIARSCWSSTSEVIRSQCIDALGMEVGANSSGSDEKISNQCSDLSFLPAVEMCKISAAAEVVYQEYVKPQKIQDTICNKLSSSSRAICYDRTEKAALAYKERSTP